MRTSIRFHNFTVVTRRAVTPSIPLDSMSATAMILKPGASGVTLPDPLLTLRPLQPAPRSPTSLLVIRQPNRSSFANQHPRRLPTRPFVIRQPALRRLHSDPRLHSANLLYLAIVSTQS